MDFHKIVCPVDDHFIDVEYYLRETPPTIIIKNVYMKHKDNKKEIFPEGNMVQYILDAMHGSVDEKYFENVCVSKNIYQATVEIFSFPSTEDSDPYIYQVFSDDNYCKDIVSQEDRWFLHSECTSLDDIIDFIKSISIGKITKDADITTVVNVYNAAKKENTHLDLYFNNKERLPYSALCFSFKNPFDKPGIFSGVIKINKY